MSINKLILLGNVGGDPKITTFQDGGKTAQFSVAATEKGYASKNGQQVPDHTEWFNLVAKGATANVVEQYVHKGDRLYAEGKIKTRQYNAQDGSQRSITEVIVERLELLSSKPQYQQQGYQQQPPQGQYQQPYQPQQGYQPQPPQGNDNLPF